MIKLKDAGLFQMSFCEAIATRVCDVLKMCIFHEAVDQQNRFDVARLTKGHGKYARRSEFYHCRFKQQRWKNKVTRSPSSMKMGDPEKSIGSR